MHILLLILKIIGIALLVILGVVLTLILLLLFVPFCYRAEGSYYEARPYAMIRVRYLFPLLHVFVQYKDETLEGKVKLFGFTIYDLFGQKETAEEQIQDQPADSAEEIPAHSTETQGDLPVDLQEDSQEDLGDALEADEKMNLLDKIRSFITTLIEKIKAFLQKLRDIRDKGLQIKEKVTYYYDIWQREDTQRAFHTAKKTLYKLWKSIRPRKGLVKFHFGTGDPGSTGQMCGYIGMLYPFVGKYVMIEPDFENKIYEGEFYFKGHITLIVFLKVAWVVLFDKDIKKLCKILMSSDKEE